MKTVKEYWIEKFGGLPQTNEEKLAIAMMTEFAKYCSRFLFKKEINIKSDEYLTKEETDRIFETNTVLETREMEDYRFYIAVNEAIGLYLKNKEATRGDFVLALNLLRSLFDLQNGSPLVSDEKEWNEVMENIKKLLGKYNV